MPMFAPCTVNDDDPVPARLILRIELTLSRSTYHPELALPALSPNVITTRRVPFAPCPIRHLKDVSDSQSVASHLDPPMCALAVYITRPILVPCTVTDADPVPALFALRVMLSPAMSTDHT